MRGLSGYIFRQCLWPTLFFTGVLTGVIWLTQSLRIIEVILNKGQGAGTFLLIAALLLPTALSIVVPIAIFCAALFSLHRFHADSELVVLWAAGGSRARIARPMIVLGVLATIVVYLLTVVLMPWSARETRDRMFEIQTDIAAGLIREGVFNTPVNGLTVYIREIRHGFEMNGILVHDARTPADPVTYMAERGALVKTIDGPRLVMVNGNIQRVSEQSGRLNMLYFDKYTYDLTQFTAPSADDRYVKPRERFLGELLDPATVTDDVKMQARLLARGHEQLSTPLYTLVFVMMALAGLLLPGHPRRGLGLRILGIVVAAVLVRVTGMAIQNASVSANALIAVTYVLPLAVIAICGLLLGDRTVSTLMRRRPAAAARQAAA